MSDEAEDRKVVSIVEYRGPKLMPDKANPAIPDHIWERFQDLGDLATSHLQRLLTDERFPNFDVKTQMRVIETTLNRAYGSIDGSVRRHMHLHVDPESDKGFNALRDMSRRANKRFPEFRGGPPHGGELTDIDGNGEPLLHDTLDHDASELPREGD